MPPGSASVESDESEAGSREFADGAVVVELNSPSDDDGPPNIDVSLPTALPVGSMPAVGMRS